MYIYIPLMPVARQRERAKLSFKFHRNTIKNASI